MFYKQLISIVNKNSNVNLDSISTFIKKIVKNANIFDFISRVCRFMLFVFNKKLKKSNVNLMH